MSDDPSAAERAARQRIRDPARAARWRAWWRGALAGLVVVALGLFALRQPLSDRLWPEARAQALRDRAALALAHGRLSETDGTGARELYEAALAIDPDRNEARTGLMRVAQAALTRAKVATTEGRYGEAHRDLQLALSLSVPRAQADAAEAQLREHEARHAGIERLLAQAAAARVQQHLDGGPDAALPIYQRILAMQPDRVEALEGRDDALSDLLQQASLALRHDDLLAAARLVAAARGYDAGHADLPGVEATLSGAIEQARRRAEGELRHGRPEAAASGFNTLLQIDPQDSFARHGVEHVAAFWAHRAERDAADFHFADASHALARARTLAPDLMAVHSAAQAIARAQQASVALRAPTPRRRSERTVRELLAGAVAAEKRGDLLTPP
ncbi:MAG: hypothetical protein JWL98_31, partial [Xanthomonadaceae bacterium]|nr:hypothetical protein [Xanthomonadaceae bacterium]